MRLAGFTGYRYMQRRDGALATENGDRRRKVESKFALRDARRALDPGMTHWRGTFLLSALEVLHLAGLRAAARYVTFRGQNAS
jgi:hypothetical protein